MEEGQISRRGGSFFQLLIWATEEKLSIVAPFHFSCSILSVHFYASVFYLVVGPFKFILIVHQK